MANYSNVPNYAWGLFGRTPQRFRQMTPAANLAMLQAAPPSPQQEAYENLRGQAAPPTQSGWSGITAQPKPSLEQEAYQNLVAEQAGANVNWANPAQPRPSPQQEAYQNLAGQAAPNPAANVTWPRGNARRRPYGYRPGLAAGNLARLQPGYGSSYAY
jgi:hypothetical protein